MTNNKFTDEQIAQWLGDAEEALIEVANRRAAMLAAAPQEVIHGRVTRRWSGDNYSIALS
ncbi:hypothetical protein AZ037_001414 [Klebsiella michiganensis]|nr:hypothetical protein AZ037_001414 [Klebsiella michiganensis]